MKNLINAILISIFIIGCQSNQEKKKENMLSNTNNNLEIKKTKKNVNQAPTAELKEYKVDISINNIGKRKIEVIINTNFPDGTNLSLNIHRTYFLKGKKDAYSGNIFNKDFSVKNGKFKTIAEINDSKWYNEHIKLVKKLPDDIQPISKISDNITINVLYTSATNQPKNVINVLGVKGEFVTGKGIKKYKGGTIGLLTTLSTYKEFYLPFEKQLSINKSQKRKKEKKILKYKIIKKQRFGLSTSSRMVYRILVEVDKIPSDDAMKRTATHIWENGNKDWTEFTVFIYLPGMDLNYSAYGIIEFNTNGISNFYTSESNFYGTKWKKKK